MEYDGILHTYSSITSERAVLAILAYKPTIPPQQSFLAAVRCCTRVQHARNYCRGGIVGL